MTFFFDATSADWRSVCNAILGFNRWRETHSGYFYLKPPPGLRQEIAQLCTRLDLDDAFSFADEDFTDRPDIAWLDLTEGWQPPSAI